MDNCCRLSLRELVICEHKSITLADITKANDNAKIGYGDVLPGRILCYRCKHPDHVRYRSWQAGMQHPSIDLVIGPDGTPAEVAVTQHFLVTDRLPRPMCDNNCFWGDCKHLAKLKALLCDHLRMEGFGYWLKSDCTMLTHLLRDTREEVRCHCRKRGCTFSYSFSYEVVDATTSSSPLSSRRHRGVWINSRRRESVWLHVERCRLRLPATAKDEE